MAGREGFCLRAQDSGLLSLPWGQSSSSQQISPEILLRARESSHNSLDSSVRSQASSYLLSKHSVPGIDCDEDSGHADAPQVTLSSWLKTCLGSIWWRFPGLAGARGWRLTSCCESSGRSFNQMGMVMVVVTPVLPTHRVLRMLKQENGWRAQCQLESWMEMWVTALGADIRQKAGWFFPFPAKYVPFKTKRRVSASSLMSRGP